MRNKPSLRLNLKVSGGTIILSNGPMTDHFEMFIQPEKVDQQSQTMPLHRSDVEALIPLLQGILNTNL
jgi:hypothetical protein